MGSDDSFSTPPCSSLVLGSAKEGNEAAAVVLWDRYYRRLCRLARQMLGTRSRLTDEEDVALSAMHSALYGLRHGRFKQIQAPDELWRLLRQITRRKVQKAIRYEHAAKRDTRRIVPHRTSVDESGSDRFLEFADDLTQAETVVAIKELLDGLPDSALKHIASLRLQGFSNHEISTVVGLCERSVERKLRLIRHSLQETLTHE